MKKINESFTCINCGKEVPLAEKTCRNHCPFCFVSRHVDEKIPGDRKTSCGGTMYPTAYEIKNGGMKILFKCQACGKEHRNKRADDDMVADLDTFIKKYKSNFDITPPNF